MDAFCLAMVSAESSPVLFSFFFREVRVPPGVCECSCHSVPACETNGRSGKKPEREHLTLSPTAELLLRVHRTRLAPEAALRAANAKFIRRFNGVEERLAARGKSPSDSDLAEMDALWDAVKLAERG